MKPGENTLRELMDTFPNDVTIADTTCIRWSVQGIGFGETVFYLEDGKLMCDNEGMSKEFVKGVLCDLVDKATFI